MLNHKSKVKSYADRPLTPLGEASGLTSTPVSEVPTRTNSPPPMEAPNPYHYQPAIASSRPEFSVFRRNSSNYAQASAHSLSKFTSISPSEETSGESSEPRP